MTFRNVWGIVMKILNINKFHYLKGGSETVYFGTAKLLREHGHTCHYFSMDHPENEPCETASYFVSQVDLGAKYGLWDQLSIAGRILYSREAKRKLSALLDHCKIDVAHLHNIHSQLSPSILHALKKRKIPVVMTLHDYKMACASYAMLAHGRPCERCRQGKYSSILMTKCVKNSLVKSTLSFCEMFLHHTLLDIYRHVDVFLSPSYFLKEKLESMGVKKKIAHIPNFADLVQFDRYYREPVPQDGSFVYFGRLSQEKGVHTLLDAAKKIAGSADIRIKIIGDGPLRKDLEGRIRDENIRNIVLLGYKNGPELFREIRKSYAVIIPSEWFENSPMTIIEAFSLGIPVIGSRIGGIPEMVIDGNTGYLFHPSDSDDLADKLLMAANQTSVLKTLGLNAKKMVEERCSAEMYYASLSNIYNEIIAKR